MRIVAGILSLLFAAAILVPRTASASLPQTPPGTSPQQGAPGRQKGTVNVPLDRFRSRKTIVRQGRMPDGPHRTQQACRSQTMVCNRLQVMPAVSRQTFFAGACPAESFYCRSSGPDPAVA